MKLPEKNNNIYPKTKKNIKHLLNYYFDDLEPDREGVIEFLLSKTSLTLNQIEFIVKKTAENYNFFLEIYSLKKLVIFLQSSVDVLTINPNLWVGSKNRVEKLFKIKNKFEQSNMFNEEEYFIGTPFIIEEEEDTEEYNEVIEDYGSVDDNNDYERDTFYALTDGQNGDYEDWQENGGDLDSLRDDLGH